MINEVIYSGLENYWHYNGPSRISRFLNLNLTGNAQTFKTWMYMECSMWGDETTPGQLYNAIPIALWLNAQNVFVHLDSIYLKCQLLVMLTCEISLVMYVVGELSKSGTLLVDCR